MAHPTHGRLCSWLSTLLMICTLLAFRAQAPSLLSFSISSLSGPLDFEAYSAAALQEGKYVWTWMPRLDCGEKGGRAEREGSTPRTQPHPPSILSNETFAGSQGLSPSRTEPEGARATCSCVRKHPRPALAQTIPEVPC